ncbi:MAG: hypothetical protein JWO98_4894 [Frankiales bacterium]|nr:hypothetical protein [Frankiales bacterium]
MTAPESLAQRVRRIHQESGSADPRELAEKVLATLDSPDALRSALSEALPDFVRITVRTAHQGGMAGPRSANVEAVRGWYERLMSQPVDVSGNGAQWKSLRECTRDELLAVAQYRRQVAARNLQTADSYERLAKVMKPGQTVGALKQDIVTNVLGRAA